MAPLEPSALGGIGVIACYCRVSSARQKTDSQKPEIRHWLEGNGIDPATVEWFEDKETGRTLKRPAFDRLQKAVFAGRVKRVESRPCQGLCSFLGLFPGRTLLSPHLRKHLGL